METRTRDQWKPYRVDTIKLGHRVLEIMNDLKKHQQRDRTQSLAPIPTAPDVLLVRRAA